VPHKQYGIFGGQKIPIPWKPTGPCAYVAQCYNCRRFFLFLGTLKDPQYVCNSIAAQSAWRTGANVPKWYAASHQFVQNVAVPRRIADWWDSTHTPPQQAPLTTLQHPRNHRQQIEAQCERGHSGGTEIRRDSIWPICPHRYLVRSRRDRIRACFHFTVKIVYVGWKFQNYVVPESSIVAIPAPRSSRNMVHLLMRKKCLISVWKNIRWTDSEISNTITDH